MPENNSNPWWLSAIVILGALLMGAGAIIALVKPSMLVAPHDEINGAVHIYAGYLVSRNLALALMLVVTLLIRARPALAATLVLTAFVQLFDAILDASEGRWTLVPGVLVLAIAFFVCASRAFGQGWWKLSAWQVRDAATVPRSRA
jgi:hypothetical protein